MMGEADKGPEKIDMEKVLRSDSGGDDAGEIEVLDPTTGEPVADVSAEDRGSPGAPGTGAPEPYYDLYVRTRADFDNYRKRIEREKDEDRARAAAALVLEILPVLDNLERAVDGGREGDPLREGVALILRQLRDCLEKAGLEPIDALGEPFDPVYHEAVATESTADFDPNRVVDVIQQGYMLRGRVIRPSLVRVAVGGAEAPSGGAEPES